MTRLGARPSNQTRDSSRGCLEAPSRRRGVASGQGYGGDVLGDLLADVGGGGDAASDLSGGGALLLDGSGDGGLRRLGRLDRVGEVAHLRDV